MFTDLTFVENTELYMKIHNGSVRLGKIADMLISLGEFDASRKINGISFEMIGLLADLNEDSPMRAVASVPGLAEHTAAACDTITKAATC